MDLFSRIQKTALFIRNRVGTTPTVGLILGSGLGSLLELMEKEVELPYSDIPGMPASTVEGHAGTMVFGRLGGRQVVAMAGRFHYYEGYDMNDVTFPVRVLKALGVETLIVSNAAGGMNKAYSIGDLVIIEDHINLFPEHPLRGPNDERLGTRFPDMSEPYDLSLVEKGKQIAAEQDINVHIGVYVGLQGPTFETRAEYRWLHTIGGDVVGMSTVPEVIVARHGGLRVFAVSVVTDLGISDHPVKVTHEEVLEAANAAAPKLARLVAGVIEKLG